MAKGRNTLSKKETIQQVLENGAAAYFLYDEETNSYYSADFIAETEFGLVSQDLMFSNLKYANRGIDISNVYSLTRRVQDLPQGGRMIDFDQRNTLSDNDNLAENDYKFLYSITVQESVISAGATIVDQYIVKTPIPKKGVIGNGNTFEIEMPNPQEEGTYRVAIREDVSNKTQHLNKTTSEINAIVSPVEGEQYYNTTLHTICFYNGTTWQRVTSINM